MRGTRIVWPRQSTVEIEDFAVQPPKSDEVVIRTRCTLISPGTERAWLLGLPDTPNQFPMYPGYSSAGEVIAIGPGVADLQVGDRVVSDANHASHATIARGRLFPLVSDLAPEQAVFFYLGTIGLQGVRKAAIQLGEPVVILGLGLIGLIALQLARADGAMPVIGLDPLEERRRLATRLGADFALDPSAGDFEGKLTGIVGPGGPAVVIECTGHPEAVNTAIGIAGYRGRVVLLGSTRGRTESVDFYHGVHRKGTLIIGAHCYVRPDTESSFGYWTLKDDAHVVLRMLESERLRVQELISHRLPAEQAPAMYSRLMEWSSDIVGVVIDWSGS